MNDLIKREDAIKAVNKAKAEGMVECPTYYIGLIPSADRPQGKWIYDVEAESKGYYWANCSQCGLQIDVHENRGYYNYCPNCGAKMK